MMPHLVPSSTLCSSRYFTALFENAQRLFVDCHRSHTTVERFDRLDVVGEHGRTGIENDIEQLTDAR